MDSALLALGGNIAGLFLRYLIVDAGSVYLQERFGLAVQLGMPQSAEIKILIGVALAGLVAGMIPAMQAYRKSLADGLSQKI